MGIRVMSWAGAMPGWSRIGSGRSRGQFAEQVADEYAPVATAVFGDAPSMLTEQVASPPDESRLTVSVPPENTPEEVSFCSHGSATFFWLVDELPLDQVIYVTVALPAEPVAL